MATKGDEPKIINLALQGGGAHGAFSWGVLDRLLEDSRIEIEGITGASAGAMNAVALAAGYHAGDREEARESLKRFWNGVLDEARRHRAQVTPLFVAELEASIAGLRLPPKVEAAAPVKMQSLSKSLIRKIGMSIVSKKLVKKAMLNRMKLFFTILQAVNN